MPHHRSIQSSAQGTGPLYALPNPDDFSLGNPLKKLALRERSDRRVGPPAPIRGKIALALLFLSRKEILFFAQIH